MVSLYSEPEISSPDITVQEDTGNAEVCVILNNPVEGPLTVDAVTEDGSATGNGCSVFSEDMKFFLQILEIIVSRLISLIITLVKKTECVSLYQLMTMT